MLAKYSIEILLVEDNVYDAEMTIMALKKRNLANSIRHVKDGAEALDFLLNADGSLKEELPRIILLDLKLPKVDGLEVLRKLRCTELGKLVPVVVLTSSKQDSDIEECYRMGVNSYMTKPVEFEDFMKVVSEMGYYWLLLNTQPELDR